MRFGHDSHAMKLPSSACIAALAIMFTACGGEVKPSAADPSKTAAAEPAKPPAGKPKKAGSAKITTIPDEDTSFHLRRNKQKSQ